MKASIKDLEIMKFTQHIGNFSDVTVSICIATVKGNMESIGQETCGVNATCCTSKV